MADARQLDPPAIAERDRGRAPFGLVLLVAATAGIVAGLVLCDQITRPLDALPAAQSVEDPAPR